MEPRPRLRRRRSVGPDDCAAARRGAQRAVRQPPHRGQPAVLLPHHRRHVRRRRARGASGPGAGRPRRAATRSSSATTSPSRALDRPGRARAGPHAPGVRRPGARAADAVADGARVRRAAGARHAHRAPQHRQAARRPRRLRGHGPRRGRREPALPLLPRPRRRAALEIDPSATVLAIERQVRDVRDARHRHPRLRHATPRAIADAGIYDFALHHDQILVPSVLRHWNLEPSSRASTPRPSWPAIRVLQRIDRIGRAGRRVARRRDEQLEAALVA